ncbi:MAG TPA: hypothetical protein VK348_00525 [Planctomycetota bacterium]|nr:hypothetical protein [Planctomycetota bacterium]
MKAIIALVVALVLGMVGLVVHQQTHKVRIRPTVVNEDVVVETISTGEQVDIDAHVPGKGLTIVEFSAAF